MPDVVQLQFDASSGLWRSLRTESVAAVRGLSGACDYGVGISLFVDCNCPDGQVKISFARSQLKAVSLGELWRILDYRTKRVYRVKSVMRVGDRVTATVKACKTKESDQAFFTIVEQQCK